MRGKPVAEVLARADALIVVDQRIAIDHVARQRRNVGDQQQDEPNRKNGEQPQQHKGHHKSPEDNRIPTQVTQFLQFEFLHVVSANRWS